MRTRHALAGSLGLVLLAATLSAAAPAKATSPTEAYLSFVAAAQKATTLDEILPHLSGEYRAMLTAQAKDQKALWLQRMKDSANMTEIKITKETTDGKKCTLEGTARSAKGMPLRGRISMVNEDGAWRLDEQGWST